MWDWTRVLHAAASRAKAKHCVKASHEQYKYASMSRGHWVVHPHLRDLRWWYIPQFDTVSVRLPLVWRSIQFLGLWTFPKAMRRWVTIMLPRCIHSMARPINGTFTVSLFFNGFSSHLCHGYQWGSTEIHQFETRLLFSKCCYVKLGSSFCGKPQPKFHHTVLLFENQ
jgi:hypothetical protein